jgi:hypothetical protein
MADFDSSDAAFFFKLRYPNGLRMDILMRDKPLMQWATHSKGFATTKGVEIPFPYLAGRGTGGTHASAYANTSPLRGKSFLVPQRHYIGFGSIFAEVIANASAGNDLTQFENAVTAAVDGKTETMGQEIHRQMWRNNNGVRALVHPTTAISGTTLTLANKEDAQLFEVDARIQALAGTAFTTLRDSGDFVTLTGVDTDLGTLTADVAWSNIAAIAAGDGLLQVGDQNVCMDGLDGIVPVTRPAPGTDLWHGVDRAAYWSRLGGTYVDAANYNIRNALIYAKSKAKQNAGPGFDRDAPFFCHPKNFAQFLMQIEGTRVNTSAMMDKYGVGLKSIEFDGHTFVEDTFGVVDHLFLISRDSLTRDTAGDQPYIETHDGSQFGFDRKTGDIEFTMRHDGNVYSRFPNRILRVKLPVVAS